MSDFNSQLPVQTLSTTELQVQTKVGTKLNVQTSAIGDVTTKVANTSNTAIDPATETSLVKLTLTQGSTTSGQSGALVQGAVSTSAPTYTNGQTNPVSLTTAGAIRVDGSATTQPVSGTITANAGTGNFGSNITQVAGNSVNTGNGTAGTGTLRVAIASDSVVQTVPGSNTPILDYNTASSIAAAGTSTHSYTPGSTFKLRQITGTASGQMKLEIQWGNTGSETTKLVGFTSKGDLNFVVNFPDAPSIANTQTIKIIRTNTDNASMDVYSTIYGY